MSISKCKFELTNAKMCFFKFRHSVSNELVSVMSNFEFDVAISEFEKVVLNVMKVFKQFRNRFKIGMNRLCLVQKHTAVL